MRIRPMQEKSDTHPTTIALADGAPTTIAVGEGFGVSVKVSCPHGCDLRGQHVTVTMPDGATQMQTLSACIEGINEGLIVLGAPRQAGEHTWRIAFDAQEHGGVHHDHSALSLAIKIEPHATSLAVWDIPSPVAMGEPFAIKVGAKSTSGCTLEGKTIEVCDSAGEVLAQGRFGAEPWPGTSALYWTEIALPAPRSEGVVSWLARFAGEGLDLPHEGTSSRFSLAAV